MCWLTNPQLSSSGRESLPQWMYAEYAYARARACMTTAAGITAQQEFRRQMSDRAACLCQQSVEGSLDGS